MKDARKAKCKTQVRRECFEEEWKSLQEWVINIVEIMIGYEDKNKKTSLLYGECQ